MKKSILYILLNLVFASIISAQESDNPKFFISFQSEGEKGKISNYETPYTNAIVFKLKEEFPCITYNSLDEVKLNLEAERKRQLLGGSNDDAEIKRIGESMSSDYLICITAKIVQQTVLLNAFCIDSKYSKPAMARSSGTCPIGDCMSEMNKIAQDLIDQLTYYEICPYTGPVSVQVVSERKEESKEEYGVYCSKQDRTYKKTTVLDKKSSADWKLEKIKKTKATGTINYSMAEKTETEENDPCYKCEPMITGNRNYSDISTGFLEINGISKGVDSKSKDEYYSTVEIKFSKDGTYTLLVKAASETGDLQTMREEKASGDCQTFVRPPENISRKSDIGIRETLGPFPGTGKEKVLQEKQTIEKTDPVTKEKTTITYDFNLRRD